jgi:hypothetical protein
MYSYIFYYYFNVGIVRPAKAQLLNGTMIGVDNRITGASWSISREEFFEKDNFKTLVELHPWPFPEGNDA